MGKYILTKFGVAIMASIILSLSLAILAYTPISEQRQGWSFSGFFILYFIFSLPVIVIGGVPISILIDKYISVKRPICRFILRTITYGLAGAVVFLLFLYVINSGELSFKNLNIPALLSIGMIGAVLFYWMDAIFRRIQGRGCK